VTNVEAEVSNNPDMVAVFWESLDKGVVHYLRTKKDQEMQIEGSPDWVLEIVGNRSVAKDTRDLRHAYHRAGIREYWLVDARGEDIHFQILHWRKAGFVAAPRDAAWQRSRVFCRWYQLTRSRDRRGGWLYQLAARSE
jgi:Uma2 family endonuclease